ncbi:MAG: Mediator of RNA polymerase II transcription subunit 18 [Chrysothrix sp. TS-e1954]|nr:MAG: Mediator of RNA polymerase II transcription subunit 18 [Chrysothrix sp. TS-e1954]
MGVSELLLSAIVPDRHDQLLRILAGVSAMPPTPTTERHLIFAPVREIPARINERYNHVGGTQDVTAVRRRPLGTENGDIWYVQLVQTAEGEEEGSTCPWEMVIYDLPDAVKRPVTARGVDRMLLSEGDAVRHVESLGYRYKCQYMLHGHRFVYNNLLLFLHRILLPPDAANSNEGQLGFREPPLPRIEDFMALDASGAHILLSSCYVADGNKPELIARGVKEQMAFKELMKGIVDMLPVERLALDTRVKPV